MKVFESDYGNFKMYVSDFKVGAPGYIWNEGDGWYKAKVTYARCYDESKIERLLEFFNVDNHEELFERFPTVFPDDGTCCGEFITDNFCYWVCMESEGDDEIPEDEVDIEIVDYC